LESRDRQRPTSIKLHSALLIYIPFDWDGKRLSLCTQPLPLASLSSEQKLKRERKAHGWMDDASVFLIKGSTNFSPKCFSNSANYNYLPSSFDGFVLLALSVASVSVDGVLLVLYGLQDPPNLPRPPPLFVPLIRLVVVVEEGLQRCNLQADIVLESWIASTIIPFLDNDRGPLFTLNKDTFFILKNFLKNVEF
jgi:hypothetical protein